MNVALIVLDTLRKDAFDRHFDWLDGMRYDNAWAPSNWTVPVHASLFTGKYASEIGVHSRATELDCEETVLAEHLSDAGYETRAFSANPNVSRRFGYDRGFDEFTGSQKVKHFNRTDLFNWSSFITETRGQGIARYVDAVRRCVFGDVDTFASLKQGFELKFNSDNRTENGDDGARTALKRIRDTTFGDEEFLFMNLMEAHAPYNPPSEYRTVENHERPTAIDAFTGEGLDVDIDVVEQAYDDAVAYLSDVYRDIHEELLEDFDYVITLSDHGELLGEYGSWDHQYGLYPELTHVPLVISGDGLSGSTDACASLLDVHGTLLDIMDVDGSSRGQNLLDDFQSRASLTEYHGMTQWLLDELETITDVEEMKSRFDTPLHGVALPPSYYGYETEDDWIESGKTDIDPSERLNQLRNDLDRREIEASDRELPEDVKSHLEDLGYA